MTKVVDLQLLMYWWWKAFSNKTGWWIGNGRAAGIWQWWAQPNHLYCPQSWSRTNNTFRLVIPAMVVGSRRAMSPSSILGLLQNIYPFPCRWKDNSPLVHRRSVTKKEWISPSMSQRIERGAPAHTQIYVYIDRSPREKGVRTHTRYSNIY